MVHVAVDEVLPRVDYEHGDDELPGEEEKGEVLRRRSSICIITSCNLKEFLPLRRETPQGHDSEHTSSINLCTCEYMVATWTKDVDKLITIQSSKKQEIRVLIHQTNLYVAS